MAKTTIMNTEQYAKDIYPKYSKTKTGSQQRIRKMISDGIALPQVISIIKTGKSERYYLLEVAN